ncbi:MAG: hypothetical protein GC190_07685 [Alphaproteobacteria bacterium]|nr:hypothetical protein [Alphaproteobacteria bacterium]
MQSLADVQRALRDAIVLRQPLADDLIDGSRAQAKRRLAVHANHFRKSLTGTLAKTFPAIVSLVDEKFFAYCADAFIDAHPPQHPCLFNYGADFAQFVASFAPCAALPYLADVARLEWDMHAVFHELPADRTSAPRWLGRCVRLLQSPYPIDRIWQVARGHAHGSVDLEAGGSALAIYRDGDDVSISALSPAASGFLSDVRLGRPLIGAIAAARMLDPTFSIASRIPNAVAAHLRLTDPSAET